MKNITLAVRDVKLNSTQITANITATNNSYSNFNTVNTSGLPVRLSWRFIKLSASGSRLIESSWDTRKDLTWTIEPSKTDQIELIAKLPKEKGRYLLEITIVQDLVSFFHDAGMSVASITVDVN